MPKEIKLVPNPYTPEPLKNILDNETVKASLDYSKPVDDKINDFLAKWRANLEERTPASIYTEGPDGYPLYSGTDYDILTLVLGLSKRRAIIKIPDYVRRTLHFVRSDEWRLTESPHGQVLGITSKEEAHSFSVLIKDFGIARKNPDGSERIGEPRNIMIVDYSGRLNPGLKEFQFMATPEERKFLKRHGIPYEESEELFRGRSFVLRQFVFPELWRVFYSPDYLVSKALTQRCKKEGSFYKKRIDYIEKEKGIRLPPLEGMRRYIKPSGKEEKIKVRNLVAELVLLGTKEPTAKDLPIISMDREGNLKSYESHKLIKSREEWQGVLRYSENRRNDLTWGLGAQIRAVSRAVEYAMFLYGFRGERRPGNEQSPDWMEGWQKEKRGWYALPFSDQAVLKYRISNRTITQKKQDLEYPSEIILKDMMT